MKRWLIVTVLLVAAVSLFAGPNRHGAGMYGRGADPELLQEELEAILAESGSRTLGDMTVEEIRAKLAPHREELTAMGVGSLAVFGSIARGEAREDSDVDLLVELNRSMGLFEYAGIQVRLEEILGCEVDLVDRRGLKPYVRKSVLAEAVDAA